MKRSTTLFDKNNQEIFEGDKIKYSNYFDEEIYYTVKFGQGTYDSGYYKFIGFYLEPLDNSENLSDGTANLLFDRDCIEVVL